MKNKKIFFTSVGVFFLCITAAMLFSKEPSVQKQVAALPPLPIYTWRAPAYAERRFKGPLPFSLDDSKGTKKWAFGTVKTGTLSSMDVWRDNKNGLIWGPKLNLSFRSYHRSNVQKSLAACAAQKPEGYWSLPSVGEFDSAQRHRFKSVGRDTKYNWISYRLSSKDYLPAARSWGYTQKYYLRCVGYSKSPK